MSLEAIAAATDALGRGFEEFKAVNDRRLQEIEKRGVADPVTVESVNKANAEITRLTGVVEELRSTTAKLETAATRPGTAAGGEKADSEDMRQYKNAFREYLKSGTDGGMKELQSKALSVGSDPDGGYLVTPAMSSEIIKKVNETTPMRSLADVMTISTDSLDIMEDRDDADAGWVHETGTRTDTGTPQLGKKNIPVHEMYAQPKATQKLLDDSAINIEDWLSEKISDIMARMENAAFASGNGVGKPRGFLTYDDGTAWGQIEQIKSVSTSGGVISPDDLVKLFYALKQEYADRGTFLMNRLTEQDIRLLKESTTNAYIWQPGLTANAPNTLLGRPVVHGADMPVTAVNSLSVAFADFKRAYQIVDRIGIRTLRDPFTDKPFVKFYTTKRVGGDVKNFEAIKLLKLDAA